MDGGSGGGVGVGGLGILDGVQTFLTALTSFAPPTPQVRPIVRDQAPTERVRAYTPPTGAPRFIRGSLDPPVWGGLPGTSEARGPRGPGVPATQSLSISAGRSPGPLHGWDDCHLPAVEFLAAAWAAATSARVCVCMFL